MINLKPFRVDPKSFHELIIMPQFGDIIDSESGNITQPSDEEGDWMIMDNESSRMPIMDLFGNKNILKRRDATCKLIYSPVARLGTRYIVDEKLYAATEDCQEEFYQGCFEDYSQANFDVFGEQVMPILEKGVASDLYSNKYFGDLTRASDPNGLWSWNKFDGIFTQYLKYVTQGLLAAPIALPSGDVTPLQAFTLLNQMVEEQDELLSTFDDGDKAIYADKKLVRAYWNYLQQTGFTSIQDRQGGIGKLEVQGIELKIKKWDGILYSLNGGTQAHAAILTLKGNFLYKTNSKYGGGAKRNEAVRVWWSDDDNVWKRQIHLRAGTEIAAPQHSVLAMTSF